MKHLAQLEEQQRASSRLLAEHKRASEARIEKRLKQHEKKMKAEWNRSKQLLLAQHKEEMDYVKNKRKRSKDSNGDKTIPRKRRKKKKKSRRRAKTDYPSSSSSSSPLPVARHPPANPATLALTTATMTSG